MRKNSLSGRGAARSILRIVDRPGKVEGGAMLSYNVTLP